MEFEPKSDCFILVATQRQTKWEDRRPLTSQEWQKRAVAVYRESTSTGQGISMRLLDRVLACLRLPLPSHSSKIDAETNSQHVLGGAVLSMQAMELRAPPNSAWGIDNAMMPLGEAINQRDNPGSEKKKHREVEIVFDARAVALLEEVWTPCFECFCCWWEGGCFSVLMTCLSSLGPSIRIRACFMALQCRSETITGSRTFAVFCAIHA